MSIVNTKFDNHVSSARIAEILRSARNLMNNNGRHWVKRIEKTDLAYVDPISRYNKLRDEELKGEYAYCSIGALKEVTGNNKEEYWAACIELARIISDDRILEDARDSYEEGWYSDHDDNYDLKAPNPTQEELYDHVGYFRIIDTITRSNDRKATTWKDVSGWFSKASARVSKRKN